MDRLILIFVIGACFTGFLILISIYIEKARKKDIAKAIEDLPQHKVKLKNFKMKVVESHLKNDKPTSLRDLDGKTIPVKFKVTKLNPKIDLD